MIRKKSLWAAIISIVIASLLTTSCIPGSSNLLSNPYSDKPSTSKNVVIQKSSRIGKSVFRFAIGGAVAGAVIGALFSDDDDLSSSIVKGTLIGGAVGAIAGYIYGRSQAKMMASRDNAVQRYQYTGSEGTMVTIESVMVNPDAIAKGSPLAFQTTYTVLTPNERDKVNVQMGFGVVLAALDENNENYSPGQLQEFQIENGGGTYQVTVPLKKTAHYEPHSYKFIVGIETDGKGAKKYATRSVKFNVLEARNGMPMRLELAENESGIFQAVN